MTFKELWMSMSVADRRLFARRCEASYNYLNLFAFGQKPRIGEAIAIAIERESAGRVTVAALRPDLADSLARSGYTKGPVAAAARALGHDGLAAAGEDAAA